MWNNSDIDGSQAFDWGKTSADYATFRRDYPRDFYERLSTLGIGLPGQRILDLATGVGFLAENFACQGADVLGIDIAAGQVATARARAAEAGLDIEYFVAAAENTGLADSQFDAVTASLCWMYFDHQQAMAEVRRLLRPGGRLVVAHLDWTEDLDSVAYHSAKLLRKYNPSWTGAGLSGDVEQRAATFADQFDLEDGFLYETPLPFTRESWLGRYRACRGVGASLSAVEAAAFNTEHDQLLREIAPPEFTVPHRIDCIVLRPHH